jgi:phosphatidylglycerophosphate synthase
MTANLITLARFPILLASLMLLSHGGPVSALAGVALVLTGLLLDTVDGIVARRLGQTSLLGSVLDIAADRTWELALWVFFADRDLVPVAIPLIVLARTSLTDGLRAVGVRDGVVPFAQHRSALGRFLVASPWMRTAYATAKLIAFCGLGTALACSSFPAGSAPWGLVGTMTSALQAVAWVTVALCVLRGVPVIVGTFTRRAAPPAVSEPAATLPGAPPAAHPA